MDLLINKEQIIELPKESNRMSLQLLNKAEPKLPEQRYRIYNQWHQRNYLTEYNDIQSFTISDACENTATTYYVMPHREWDDNGVCTVTYLGEIYTMNEDDEDGY